MVALVLVSVGVALIMQGFDASSLAKLDSMSAAAVVEHQRSLHSHSFVFHFISWLIAGGFYVGIVEFITYVIGLLFQRKSGD